MVDPTPADGGRRTGEERVGGHVEGHASVVERQEREELDDAGGVPVTDIPGRADEDGCRSEQSHLDRPGHRDVGEAGAVGGEPRADRHDHRRTTGLGEEPVEEVELPARRGDRGELDSVGQKGGVVACDFEPLGAATTRGHDPGDRPGGGEGAFAIGAGRVAADHDERVGPSVIAGTGLGPEGVRRGEVGEDGLGCGVELVAVLARRRGVDAHELDSELLGPRHGAERRHERAERPVDELVGSVDPESPTATEDEQIRRVFVVTERDEGLDEATAVGGERRELRRLDGRVEHPPAAGPPREEGPRCLRPWGGEEELDPVRTGAYESHIGRRDVAVVDEPPEQAVREVDPVDERRVGEGLQRGPRLADRPGARPTTFAVAPRTRAGAAQVAHAPRERAGRDDPEPDEGELGEAPVERGARGWDRLLRMGDTDGCRAGTGRHVETPAGAQSGGVEHARPVGLQLAEVEVGEQWPVVDAPGRPAGHVGQAFVAPDGDGRARLAGGTVDGDGAGVVASSCRGGRDRYGRHAAETRGHERRPGRREQDEPGDRGGPSRRPRAPVDSPATTQGAADLSGEIHGRGRPEHPDDEDREVGRRRHGPRGGETHEARRQGREQPESGERERHPDDEDRGLCERAETRPGRRRLRAHRLVEAAEPVPGTRTASV